MQASQFYINGTQTTNNEMESDSVRLPVRTEVNKIKIHTNTTSSSSISSIWGTGGMGDLEKLLR